MLIPGYRVGNPRVNGHLAAGMELYLKSGKSGHVYSQLTKALSRNHHLSTGAFEVKNIDTSQLLKMVNSQNAIDGEDSAAVIHRLPGRLPLSSDEKDSLLTPRNIKMAAV